VTIEDMLKRKSLEATALNQYGEGIILGEPQTVRHLKKGYVFSWAIKPSTHKSPFDTVLFHLGNKVLKVIYTNKFRMDGKERLLTVRLS
jgi:hypothetical protein